MSLRRWRFRDRRPEDELGVLRRGLDEVGLAHEFSAGEGGDLVAEELGELEGKGVGELGEGDGLRLRRPSA